MVRILFYSVLALAMPVLSATEWTELRFLVVNSPSGPVTAGTQLNLDLNCKVVTVSEQGETEALFTGTASVWFLERGTGPEPVSVLTSVDVEFASGEGQFVWAPEIAGSHALIVTLPQSPEILPGQSAPVDVIAGNPTNLVTAQFENQMSMVPFDGGELGQWLNTGFGGSTWIWSAPRKLVQVI